MVNEQKFMARICDNERDLSSLLDSYFHIVLFI